MLEKKIQIKILEKVLDKLINSRHIEKLGLCTLISREIKKELNLEDNFPTYTLINIESYIPLFTRLNAVKYAYGNVNGMFWWSHNYYNNGYDFTNRILFINWIISKLNTELNTELNNE